MPANPYKHVVASEHVLNTLGPDDRPHEQLLASYAIAERLEALVSAIEDLDRNLETSGANMGATLTELRMNLVAKL